MATQERTPKMKSVTATAIQSMSQIIDETNVLGYTVVSGHVLEAGMYAFYALHKNKLTDVIEDVYFTAKRGRGGMIGKWIYAPMTADEYHDLKG
jgi:hypothetical protein